MATEIKEVVKVAAIFDHGIKPVKFSWKGRVYPVKEITYRWERSFGGERIVHFSVTDGATLFELSYNGKEMRWTLENTELL